jgi:NAD+ synthase (glutamine-hydrolysing)
MQAAGLVKRLRAIRCKVVLVGLSGGLDSTLALLVCHEAFKKLGFDYKGIHAITMPAFGTSKRTHDNAVLLAQELGISFEEIAIKDSLRQHFKDIHHDESDQNLTYENAQARERTQLLMDYSGDLGGIMVGTGDLSELCLGWTTYNGDHMSMYGVNASIPKTLVRYLVSGYALLHPECADSLNDIVDTPISPELLPTDSEGRITQKTEDKVGPYELNDFFIYHFLRFGYRPAKLFFLAKQAYAGVYDGPIIKKWLRAFFNRFFHNQFKRSCLPDGAKVGTVAISPRGDLRMPSDASASDFLKEVDAL